MCAAQGDIKVADEVHDLAKLVGWKTFVIPERVVVRVEEYLHQVSPIQVCLLVPGVKTKDEAFSVITARDEATSDSWRYVGTAFNVTGTFYAMQVRSGTI